MKRSLFLKLGVSVLVYVFSLSATYSMDDDDDKQMRDWEKDIYSFQKSIEEDKNHDREQLNIELNYLMSVCQEIGEKPMKASNSSVSKARSLVLKTLNHEEISSMLGGAIDHAFSLSLIDDKMQSEGKNLARIFSKGQGKKGKKEKVSNTSYKEFCAYVKILHERFDSDIEMSHAFDIVMDDDEELF